ncbi:radical SAM protein, partial [Desulfosarcina sp. OttesenSCG-928-G10]|nr:radical SAM protein [Desulfosarcina sp. OttesenSCG-928-G10]
MIARMEGNQLHTFSRQSGMNAVFSGRELALLLAHAQTGGITPFIQRLFDLGVLPHDASARQEILRAVRMSEDGKTKAKPSKHRLPRSLHIEVTGLCPFTCPQCYQAKRRTGHMPFSLLEQLVDEASEIGIFQIALGGGEPLIYPDLCRAIRRIAATGMGVSITSSGYGLTADTLSALADAGLNHLQISLNAVRQDVNRLSRAGHDEAMAALELLSGRKLSFGINWTARKDTLPGLPELLALAADLGADTVNMLRYKPSPAETYATVAPNRVEIETLAGLIAAHTGVPLTLDSAFANLRCLVQSGQRSCFQYG